MNWHSERCFEDAWDKTWYEIPHLPRNGIERMWILFYINIELYPEIYRYQCLEIILFVE